MKRRMVGGSGLLEQTHHYRLEDVFDKEDLYWKDDVRASHRFVTDLHEMVDSTQSLKVSQGIMVKAPRRNWQVALACQSRPKVDVRMQEKVTRNRYSRLL